MKRIPLLLSLLLLVATSCSHIDEDERLIRMERAAVGRAVLIEDFTGQRCSNCPLAAEEIQRLKASYGADTIIAVGIHGGPLAVYPTDKVLGLRTAEGDEYVEHWGIANTLPKGYVNRMKGIANYDQWGGLVYEAIQLQAPADLKATFQQETGTNTLAIHTEVTAYKALEAKLQVWITESGITALQAMPDGTTNRDYVHNHVFRTAVNGTWGEDISVAEGQTAAFDYSLEPGSSWVSENLSVVIFIYDEEGVQQVIEQSLNTETHE